MSNENVILGLENELKVILETMSVRQSATWMLRLINDHIQMIRSDGWWNPFAVMAMILSP
jgi:hypothetical protein